MARISRFRQNRGFEPTTGVSRVGQASTMTFPDAAASAPVARWLRHREQSGPVSPPLAYASGWVRLTL
ncbi:MAG: hypothetical protein L0338_37975 [Acidobacteria bacterium]|nr:hypothetical protein [Acidobacteriota bacterium]